MAVRRELAKNECVGASRLRIQAHVFLTKQKNKLTDLQGSRKKFDKVKDFWEEEPQHNKPGSLRPANCRKVKLTATRKKAFALTRLRIAFLPRGGAGQSIYSALNQLLRLLLSIKIVKNGKSAIIAAMSSVINCSIVLKPCRAINTMITARTTG